MDYNGYDDEDAVLEEIERREARKDAISGKKRYQKQGLIDDTFILSDDTADCLPGIGRSCSKKYNKLKNKVSSFFKPNTNTGGRKICKNNKRTCKKYRKSKRNKKNNKRK